MTAASGADRCPVGRTVNGNACDGPGGYYCDSEVWGSDCRAHFERIRDALTEVAHVAAGTDQPTLRDQLAQALADEDGSDGLPLSEMLPGIAGRYRRLADALLPVIEAREAALRDMLGTAQRQIDAHKQAADEHQAYVEGAKAEGGAEALERAAGEWADSDPATSWSLSTRAAALRGSTGSRT